jgi:PAS domain S-box-containing protein
VKAVRAAQLQSVTDIARLPRHVRSDHICFAPNNDQKADIAVSRFSATKRLHGVQQKHPKVPWEQKARSPRFYGRIASCGENLLRREPLPNKSIEALDHKRRLELLVHAVVDYALYLLNPEGTVVSWNPGARRLKGYEDSEIIGQHFSHFFTREDRERGIPKVSLETAAREGRFESEGWRVRKDGSRFWALAVIDAIRDDNGDLLGFVKITRDMTEQMEAQRVLRETQERLAASQKMEAVGQLSGGIAHDFNNLLMIVLGNLETMQRYTRQGDNPNMQRAVNNAMRGAQRAASLTQRLLAFSRRQALNPKPLDISKFAVGSAEFLQRSLGETVEIETVGSAGLWTAEVDYNQLEVALLNLALNSRDAMPKGGKLTIEAANAILDHEYCRSNPEVSPGQYVLLSVSDTGEGMSKDVLNRAFEPFFTTKESGQGTGLGLSQVYGFVKQSGGHIKIYSEVGQGTTVKIYLPRFFGSKHDDEIADEALLGVGENGETVLIVEDDDDLRGYLADVVHSLGYGVAIASNANVALDLLNQPNVHFDLMLTDVVMPEMNGRELAENANKVRPDLKVIYMTGYSRNAVTHHGRLDPHLDVLQKPITQSELATRIRESLDKGRCSMA